MPKYEVISPFQADEAGQFITHTLHRRSRRKRSTGQQQFWFYSVNAFGSSLHLNVTKAKNILSPGSIVETTHKNGSISYSTPPKNTFHRGHVVSHPGSAVTISNLNGLVWISQMFGSIKQRDQRILAATTLIRAFLSIPFVKSAVHNFFDHSLLLLKKTIHADLHNETTQSPTHRANR